MNIENEIKLVAAAPKRNFTTALVIGINRMFAPVRHPFNLSAQGIESYAEWEFEQSSKLSGLYGGHFELEGKRVLDLGCGSGGKSVYFLTHGAAFVLGVDCICSYAKPAAEFADRKGVGGRFEFICADAAGLPLEDESFDAVTMNDSFEHFKIPGRVLDEAFRVLKPGGRLYVNFPPYSHPYGAHLSDLIAIPWVHLIFSEQTLINAYRSLAKELPDGEARTDFRFSKLPDGSGEYISYINHMSAKYFKTLVKASGFKRVYYRELPLRGYLSPLAALPGIGKPFVGCVAAVLEKPEG